MRAHSSWQSSTVSPWSFLVVYAVGVLLFSFAVSTFIDLQNQAEDEAAWQRLQQFSYEGFE